MASIKDLQYWLCLLIWIIITVICRVIALPASMHLTCQLEFEKLVHIEGEMIDFCRAVIQEEHKLYDKEDIHDFSAVLDFLEIASEHERHTMDNEHAIIENPLAMYKVKSWLHKKWPPILDVMMESRLVNKRPELMKLLDEYQQVIGDIDINSAVKEIAELMFVYELPVHAVAMGTFGQAQIDPLKTEDIFQFAASLNDLEYYKTSLEWLKIGVNYCNTSGQQKNTLHYNNLLGTTYLKLQEYNKAKAVFSSILETDNSNRGAKSNLKLIEQKQTDKHRAETSTLSVLENDTYVDDVKKYCHDNLPRNTQILKSREIRILGSNETFRIEEIHKNPDVFIVHDVFDKHRRRVLIERSADRLWSLLNSRFAAHQIRHQGSKVYFTKDKWWMEPYIVRMRNITYRSPVDFEVHNTLLGWTYAMNYGAGMRSKMIHTRKKEIKTNFQKQQIAQYYIFLQAPEYGGELAFPELQLKIKPVEGAGVFWQFRTPVGGVHRRLVRTIHCPVLLGAQWSATFSVEHQGMQDWIEFK